MKKRNSIICFILSIVLIAGLCFVTIFGIDKDGRGSAANIIQGLDLQGGVSITFEVADEDFSQEDFEDTVRKMEKRAYELSDEASIYTEGSNRITVEIPGQDDAQAVLDKLGKPGSLQFITNFGDEENQKVWLEGDDIADAQPLTTKDQQTNAVQYMVELKFNDDAAETFSNVTKEFTG